MHESILLLWRKQYISSRTTGLRWCSTKLREPPQRQLVSFPVGMHFQGLSCLSCPSYGPTVLFSHTYIPEVGIPISMCWAHAQGNSLHISTLLKKKKEKSSLCPSPLPTKKLATKMAVCFLSMGPTPQAQGCKKGGQKKRECQNQNTSSEDPLSRVPLIKEQTEAGQGLV